MSAVDQDWRPRIRAGVHVVPTSDSRWQIRFGFDHVSYLSGHAAKTMLPWLIPKCDGTRSVLDLEREGDLPCSKEELHEVLSILRNENIFDLAASQEIGDIQIQVFGRSQLATYLADSLREANHDVVEFATPTNSYSQKMETNVFPVVLEQDFSLPEIEEFNNQILQRRLRWILGAAHRTKLLIGPHFVPGETACYCCYRKRLDSHRRQLASHNDWERWIRDREVPVGREDLPTTLTGLFISLMALEVTEYVARRQTKVIGRVLLFDPTEWTIKRETVLRIPWCPACEAIRIPASP